jgi:hypothetical protein
VAKPTETGRLGEWIGQADPLDGEIVTMEMGAVIETRNRCATRLANES